MPISEADVIAVYRYVLGREPESQEVVALHAGAYRSVEECRQAAIRSEEFLSQAMRLGVPYFPEDKWVKTDIRNGLGMWVNLRDPHVSRACLHDNWEEPVVSFVLSHLKKGDGFIDIGANIGWFSLIAGQRLKNLGGGQVVAFEPRSDLNTITSRSIHDNGLQDIVTLHRLALADKDGELELAWNNDNAAATYLATQGVHEGGYHETVRVGRLDDVPIAATPTIIKSDAEGAEGLVFKGGQQLLLKHRPIIVSEFNIPRLPVVSGMTADYFLSWMKANGYNCFLLTEEGAIGQPILSASASPDPAANVVFKPI